MMDAKELSKLIKERVVLIGTSLEHMKTISKYAIEDNLYADAFACVYFSLQNYVYIELFKLFDTGKGANDLNVYRLIKMIDDERKTYMKKISVYKNDIKAIKTRRNKVFAHELGQDGKIIFENNPVQSNLEDLLKCVVEICCVANKELYPNIYVSNKRYFDDWCYMSIGAIK